MEVINRVRPAGRLARVLASGVDCSIAACAVLVAAMLGSQMSLAQITTLLTPDTSLTPAEQQQAALAAGDRS